MDCYSTTSGLPSPATQLNLCPLASVDLATDEVGLQGIARLSLPNLPDQGLSPEDEGFGGELEGSGVWVSSPRCNREGVSNPAFGLAAVSDDSYYPSAGGLNFIDSPKFPDELAALEKFLPSNNYEGSNNEENIWHIDSWLAMDLYSCDEFRMYEFKVRRCTRAKSHNWTECPFAHPGEKARRRDPRRFHYSGVACPDFRKGSCVRGDACEYAHGVFECWLHPARYRTQPCRDGRNCKRRVCFFAHTVDQLRVGESGAACVRRRAKVSALPSSPAAFVGSDRLSELRMALSACIACHGKDAGYEVPAWPFSPAVGNGSVAASCLEEESSGDTDFDLKLHRCQAVSQSLALEISDQLSCGCCSVSPPAPVYWPLPPPALSCSPFLNSRPTNVDQDPDVPLFLPSLLRSCCSTPDLLSALQQLQLTPYSIEASQATSSPWSFEQPWQVQLPHRSLSFSKPITRPTYAHQAEPWAGNQIEVKPERRRSVESGGFSNLSKTCGRIRNQHCTEIDVPDFGWVNELVK